MKSYYHEIDKIEDLRYGAFIAHKYVDPLFDLLNIDELENPNNPMFIRSMLIEVSHIFMPEFFRSPRRVEALRLSRLIYKDTKTNLFVSILDLHSL